MVAPETRVMVKVPSYIQRGFRGSEGRGAQAGRRKGRRVPGGTVPHLARHTLAQRERRQWHHPMPSMHRKPRF